MCQIYKKTFLKAKSRKEEKIIKAESRKQITDNRSSKKKKKCRSNLEKKNNFVNVRSSIFYSFHYLLLLIWNNIWNYAVLKKRGLYFIPILNSFLVNALRTLSIFSTSFMNLHLEGFS